MEEFGKFLNENSSAIFSLLTLLITSLLAGIGWIIKKNFDKRKSKNRLLFEEAVKLSYILIELEKKYFKTISSWTEVSQKELKENDIDISYGYNKLEDAKTIIRIFFPKLINQLSARLDVFFNFLFSIDNKQAFHKKEINPTKELEITSIRNAAQNSLSEAIELIANQIRNRYYDH